MCVYMFVSLVRVCVVYVVKKLHHSGGLGQLMGVARKRMRARSPCCLSATKEEYHMGFLLCLLFNEVLTII